jgi:hypothetical protein
MFTDVKKEKRKKTFDVTILTEVVIGILNLWNASTYLSIPQKNLAEKQQFNLLSVKYGIKFRIHDLNLSGSMLFGLKYLQCIIKHCADINPTSYYLNKCAADNANLCI